LTQKAFHSLAVIGEIPRRIVHCVEKKHYLGRNRNRFATHGSKGYDGPRLVIFDQRKITRLESGNRAAGCVRHFYIQDNAMLGQKAGFSLLVRTRDQSRRLTGLRPGGLAAEQNICRRQGERKKCGDNAHTPRPRQLTLPPATAKSGNPRTYIYHSETDAKPPKTLRQSAPGDAGVARASRKFARKKIGGKRIALAAIGIDFNRILLSA
jgi:hypothetical protein